ncbi:MAG: LEA type 2 family protein [Phycisphaeraceae bacterium]|nr:LEA type 2 family protein [Phycisphaeraceae bacterium]
MKSHLILCMLIASTACLALGGCSSARAPSLSVSEVHVIERTSEGVAVEFVLDAENPNQVELPLRQVFYSLTVDGRRVFTGERSAEATLRRDGTQQIRLPAVVPLGTGDGALRGIHPYRLHGTMRYVTPGAFAEAMFEAGLNRPSISFSDSGTIDFGD